ncbi:MAG: DUF262 domain-containing protein [Ardenticatenaceae bacterium]
MADEKVSDQVIFDDQDTKQMDSYEDGVLYPDKMPDEVDIKEKKFSVFEWLRKLKKKQLILEPEFQRNLAWTKEQKSRFIESILLYLPLPPLYVNQNTEGKFIIVDGLQRTTTLADFLKDDGFALSNLQILRHLNGYVFKELSPKLRTRIEDKNLLVYMIKPTVPLPMVYDIFNRINTGGTQLTRQEIRNCLFSGRATQLLKELSEEPYFRKAIDNGISPKRMKDREAILRYLAFRILGYHLYRKKNMDEFLNQALKEINKMNESQIGLLKQDFERVMTYTYAFWGEENFRLPTQRTRGRINIALLEAVGYFFAIKSNEFLQNNQKVIQRNYKKLLKEDRFIQAVRSSTNDPKKVSARFELVQEILGDVRC